MHRKSSIRLALAALLLLAAAACTQVTAPGRHGVDSTSCRSGYTVIGGVVVCNPT